MILKTLLRIIVSVVLASTKIMAFEVTHLVRPHSVYETSSLNQSCLAMKTTTFARKCNPAFFPYSQDEKVSISIVGKADGDSIDNGRDLIFDPITEDLIRKLFEEKNFNSFTFSSDITFTTGLFEISYSPYYLLADLFIFNPAFPEISINLVNRESLQLTKGWELGEYRFGEAVFTGSFGGSVFYYEHAQANNVFSLFDLTIEDPGDLISFETTYGLAGDLGYSLASNLSFIPDVSFVMKNIGSKVEENKAYTDSSVRQSTIFLFEPYAMMGLGKGIKTRFGVFNVNYNIPFNGYFEEVRLDHQVLGFHYGLKLFSLFSSFSKYYQSYGMRFNSNNFNVGISYLRERDIGDLQEDGEDSVYTGIDFNL